MNDDERTIARVIGSMFFPRLLFFDYNSYFAMREVL
jgi:hypothetical protein